MALVEICNSTFNHANIEFFGKKYFKHRFKDKIICEECLHAYLNEAASTLSWEIFDCLKNVDMKKMNQTSDVDRTDTFSFTYERSLITDFMQYILPINFKINISLTNEKVSAHTYTTLSTDTIGSISNNPVNIIRVARVNISPIVCDSSYPSFYLCLEIRENDSEEIIAHRINEYLASFVNTFFKELPDIAVQKLMDNKANGAYHCEALNSTKGLVCSNCNVDISGERYIYNNKSYCLNCMYELVIQAAIDNNISDLVGLSNITNTTHCAIYNSIEWKRSVIDKYINAMKLFGVNTNINHYIMTCY